MPAGAKGPDFCALLIDGEVTVIGDEPENAHRMRIRAYGGSSTPATAARRSPPTASICSCERGLDRYDGRPRRPTPIGSLALMRRAPGAAGTPLARDRQSRDVVTVWSAGNSRQPHRYSRTRWPDSASRSGPRHDPESGWWRASTRRSWPGERSRDLQTSRQDRDRTDAREAEVSRRLTTVPGVGPISATAIAALAPPAETFVKGRDFAAWLGLTPLQRSTGGKQKLGATSEMGERTLRRLLIIGSSAVVQQASKRGAPKGSWLEQMLARKPRMLVTVALANKMARIVWALLVKQENYRAPVTAKA